VQPCRLNPGSSSITGCKLQLCNAVAVYQPSSVNCALSVPAQFCPLATATCAVGLQLKELLLVFI
jgi:hypothetical protein